MGWDLTAKNASDGLALLFREPWLAGAGGQGVLRHLGKSVILQLAIKSTSNYELLIIFSFREPSHFLGNSCGFFLTPFLLNQKHFSLPCLLGKVHWNSECSILAVLQIFCCLTGLTNTTFWKSCLHVGISAFLFGIWKKKKKPVFLAMQHRLKLWHLRDSSYKGKYKYTHLWVWNLFWTSRTAIVKGNEITDNIRFFHSESYYIQPSSEDCM